MKRNPAIILLIMCIWFVISFVTNILGPIMPEIINTYHINLTLAAFLPFSFFLAYGIMSIPAGLLIEQYGAKTAMLVAFGLNFIGAAFFVFNPVYPVALASLFIIGAGMAMLQVIINPLTRVAGGEENFAFFSVLGQGVFGGASFLSPFFFTFLTREMAEPQREDHFIIRAIRLAVPAGLPWIALYFFFVAVFLIMLVAISSLRLPRVELQEDEKAGAWSSYRDLIKNKRVWMYFLGIMAYVGTEQGLADWMSKFLASYHQVDPLTIGASTIAWFWGSMAIGCLVGLVVLKISDSKQVLRAASLLALLGLSIALFGSARWSLVAFPACGFIISVIFSIVFSLALNSEKSHHGSYSGILCSGIFGGALVPLVIGWLGDRVGLRPAMTFIYVPLLYILSISFWAKPLVNNKIVKIRELYNRPNLGVK